MPMNHRLLVPRSSFKPWRYAYTPDPAVFYEMFQVKPQTETVRIAMLGDSQESAPGGNGNIYSPRLNYELWRLYGKVGESHLYAGYGSYGSGSPPATWLAQGSFGGVGTGITASTITTAQKLPAMDSRVFANTAYGQLTYLDPSNANVLSDNNLSGIQIWNNTHEIHARIFAKQRSPSSEVVWYTLPTSGALSFFVSVHATGTTSMGLNDAAGGFVSAEVGPLSWNGHTRQQFLCKGAGANGAEYIGCRFRNASTPGGISVQSFASGGYRVSDFLTSHADAGPLAEAAGPWDAYAIHLGANDALNGGGLTAADFRDDVQSLVDLIRGAAWANDGDKPIILFTDPFANGTSDQRSKIASYHGALVEVADANDNILVVDGGAAVAAYGWNENGFAPYLSDTVHYTAAGAILLARLEAAILRHGVRL